MGTTEKICVIDRLCGLRVDVYNTTNNSMGTIRARRDLLPKGPVVLLRFDLNGLGHFATRLTPGEARSLAAVLSRVADDIGANPKPQDLDS